MPIKSIRVGLSFIPNKLARLCQFGEEHQMHSNRDNLKDATICPKIVGFILELRWDPDLRANGGRFWI